MIQKRVLINYIKIIPDISSFYSKLNKSECVAKDYKHAKNAYKAFKCKNILD